MPGNISFELVRCGDRGFRRGDGERLFPELLSGLPESNLFLHQKFVEMGFPTERVLCSDGDVFVELMRVSKQQLKAITEIELV